MDADVIVIGAGLAGLVATAELADAGRRVLLLDQESEHNLGGQAYWSFGGLFLVDSPEQRRMGIRDSVELAWQDWLGSAGFDRDEDHWPRRWAQAYVHGNSVPRFHVTWGTGPGVVEPFAGRVHDAAARGLVRFRFRHRVDELVKTAGVVTGVRGRVLEPR